MLTSNFIILTHDREHLLYVLGFDFPKLNAHGQWSIILREREGYGYEERERKGYVEWGYKADRVKERLKVHLQPWLLQNLGSTDTLPYNIISNYFTSP